MPSLSHLVSEATTYSISNMSHDHHPPPLLDPLQESKKGTVDAFSEGEFSFKVEEASPADVKITFTSLADPVETGTVSRFFLQLTRTFY